MLRETPCLPMPAPLCLPLSASSLRLLLPSTGPRHGRLLQTAVEKAVAGLQEVLLATATACGPAALAAERTSEVQLPALQSRKAVLAFLDAALIISMAGLIKGGHFPFV